MEAYHFRPGVYLEVPVILLFVSLLLGLCVVMPSTGWSGAILAIAIYLLIFFVFGAFSVYSITVDEYGIRQHIEGKWLKLLVRKAPFDFDYTHIRYVELVQHGLNQQALRIVALDGQYGTISSWVYPAFTQLVDAINLSMPVQLMPLKAQGKLSPDRSPLINDRAKKL